MRNSPPIISYAFLRVPNSSWSRENSTLLRSLLSWDLPLNTLLFWLQGSWTEFVTIKVDLVDHQRNLMLNLMQVYWAFPSPYKPAINQNSLPNYMIYNLREFTSTLSWIKSFYLLRSLHSRWPFYKETYFPLYIRSS